MKEKAKKDVTYCTNRYCDKKCFRHESHYEFEDNGEYWWQMYCTDYLERKKDEQSNI